MNKKSEDTTQIDLELTKTDIKRKERPAPDKSRRADIKLYPAMLSTLEQTLEQGGVYRLWQNRSGGKREFVDARLVRLNRDQSRLQFVPVNEGDESKLIRGEEVFAHCQYRGLLFRAHLLRASMDVIELRFPEQLQVQDARIEDRESFGLCSEFFATIRYKDEKGNILEKELKILDHSENGLCLIVDQRLYKLLSRSKSLMVIKSTANVVDKGTHYRLRNRSALKGNMTLPTFRLGFEKS